MAPSLNAAESQWLSQLATMRAAIAELNLAKVDDSAIEYGQDLHLDDEDLLPIQGGNDLWDLISDISEDEYTSGESESPPSGTSDLAGPAGVYDRDWLSKQCVAVSTRNSGLDAHALQDQVEAVLASDSNGKLVIHFSKLHF
jgi:antiviral helicase SLH1